MPWILPWVVSISFPEAAILLDKSNGGSEDEIGVVLRACVSLGRRFWESSSFIPPHKRLRGRIGLCVPCFKFVSVKKRINYWLTLDRKSVSLGNEVKWHTFRYKRLYGKLKDALMA